MTHPPHIGSRDSMKHRKPSSSLNQPQLPLQRREHVLEAFHGDFAASSQGLCKHRHPQFLELKSASLPVLECGGFVCPQPLYPVSQGADGSLQFRIPGNPALQMLQPVDGCPQKSGNLTKDIRRRFGQHRWTDQPLQLVADIFNGRHISW